MGQTAAYWTAFIGYSLIAAGLGVYTGTKIRRNLRSGKKHALEFWMAGRELSGWRLGVSLTSGWMMLGWIGFGMAQIYMYGVTGLWILPIPWFILCIIVIFMVPFVRRVPTISLPEALEKRFGKSVRVVVALFSFCVFIAWTQAELFMAGSLMAPFLAIDARLCMALLIVPIIVYTYFGGFRAIVLTDILQFGIMAIFMIVLAAIGWQRTGATGIGNFIEKLGSVAPPAAGADAIFSPWVLGCVFPIVLLIGYLPGWMVEQDLVLRIQAARNTKEAYRGAVVGLVLITIFVLVLPALVAFTSLIVYPPADGAANVAVGADATGIITALIGGNPLWLTALMLLGIVACQMSTVDTFSNVTAMPLAYDLYPLLVKKNAVTERTLAPKIISIAALLLALCAALASDRLGDVYYISSGVLSASIAVPAIFIFWKRTTTPAVLAASIAGFIGTVGMYFVEYKLLQADAPAAPLYYADCLPGWLHGSFMYNYVAFGVVVAATTIVVTSLLTRRTERENNVYAGKPVAEDGMFSNE